MTFSLYERKLLYSAVGKLPPPNMEHLEIFSDIRKDARPTEKEKKVLESLPVQDNNDPLPEEMMRVKNCKHITKEHLAVLWENLTNPRIKIKWPGRDESTELRRKILQAFRDVHGPKEETK